jgi:beta-lactamase regulating signal transducer with metallopeptidase domain
MSSLFAMRALLFAGEMFFASTLVVALARAATVGRPASVRHLVWLVAFSTLLFLPLLAAFAPTFVQFALSAPAAPAVDQLDVAVTTATTPEPTAFSLDAATIVRLLLAAWLGGACLIALRSIAAAFGLRALRRNSVVHDFDDLPNTAARCELRISTGEDDCGPVTWGVLRPVILLPKNSVFWTRERFEAVLLHEQAHIARCDSLAQMLSWIACAIYWPNPLVWVAARMMRREAEIAADDAVIVSGVKPSVYAGELLDLATEFQAQRLSPAMPLFMAAPSSLEVRLKSVLAPTQQRSGVTKMDVLKITCAALLTTTAMVLARPSLAQDAPPSPPTPPAAVEQQALPPAPPAAPQDIPPPPAPPSAEALSAPPALPAPSAMPIPPVPPAADTADDRHIVIIENGHRVGPEEEKRIRVLVTKARAEARAAMAKARPEIERAMAEVRRSEIKIKGMRDEGPEVDAELAKVKPEIDAAIEQARVELRKAKLDDVKIKESVDKALQKVEIRIEARKSHEKDATPDESDTDTSKPDNN